MMNHFMYGLTDQPSLQYMQNTTDMVQGLLSKKGKRDDKYSIFDNTIINLLNKDLFELIEKSRVNIHWQANKNKISKGISKVKYELEDI